MQCREYAVFIIWLCVQCFVCFRSAKVVWPLGGKVKEEGRMLALCRSHLPVVSSAGCPERCPSDLHSVGDQS